MVMADFLFAAWFLWMTPADAAWSSLRVAAFANSCACSVSPASAASRKRRIDVFNAERTDLLRSCAASVCLLRLICDLMFATGQASVPAIMGWSIWVVVNARPGRTRLLRLPAAFRADKISAFPRRSSECMAYSASDHSAAGGCEGVEGSGRD